MCVYKITVGRQYLSLMKILTIGMFNNTKLVVYESNAKYGIGVKIIEYLEIRVVFTVYDLILRTKNIL